MEAGSTAVSLEKRRRGGHVDKYYIRDLLLPFTKANPPHECIDIADAANFCGVSYNTARAHVARNSRVALNGTYIIRSRIEELFGEEEFVIPFDRVSFTVMVGDTLHKANIKSVPDVRRAMGAEYSTLFVRFLCEAASETPNSPVRLRSPFGPTVTITAVTPRVANYCAIAQINNDRWRRDAKSTQLDGMDCRYSFIAFTLLMEWVAENPNPSTTDVAQFLEDCRPWFEGKQTGSWMICGSKVTVISNHNAEGDPANG